MPHVDPRELLEDATEHNEANKFHQKKQEDVQDEASKAAVVGAKEVEIVVLNVSCMKCIIKASSFQLVGLSCYPILLLYCSHP